MDPSLSLLFVVFAPLLGAIIGSAVNALVPRLARNEGGWLTERSRCPHCKTTLKARHLVPVLSYLVLRGRCASCRVHIPLQYLFVELAGAAAFGLVALKAAQDPSMGVWHVVLTLALVVALLALSAYDALTMELPFVLLIPALLLATALSLLPGASFTSSLIGAGFAATFYGLQILVLTPLHRRRARQAGLDDPGGVVGAGDLVLALVPGIACGWPNVVVALGGAYLLGALVTIPMLLVGKARGEHAIPFGPFLAAGTLVAILYGDAVSSAYLRLLGL